jgi:hypothetical protein
MFAGFCMQLCILWGGLFTIYHHSGQWVPDCVCLHMYSEEAFDVLGAARCEVAQLQLGFGQQQRTLHWGCYSALKTCLGFSPYLVLFASGFQLSQNQEQSHRSWHWQVESWHGFFTLVLSGTDLQKDKSRNGFLTVIWFYIQDSKEISAVKKQAREKLLDLRKDFLLWGCLSAWSH